MSTINNNKNIICGQIKICVFWFESNQWIPQWIPKKRFDLSRRLIEPRIWT